MSGSLGSPQVRRQTERLLNLLIALRSAAGWIDAASLREKIEDYRELDYEAFDRKFSRDKELLRGLGIEISVKSWEDVESGAPAYGYRIDDDDYALRDIVLDRDEALALTVASDVLRGTELGPDAARALDKLRGLGLDLEPGHAEFPAGSGLREAAFAPLMRALGRREPVGFDYRKPGGEPQRRRLEPYALLNRGDSTYVVGQDIDRSAIRTFRLSRIIGTISAVQGRAAGDYAIPTEFRAADWFDPGGPAQETARLAVAPGAADPLRRRASAHWTGPEGWDHIEVPVDSGGDFIDYLLGFGPAVRVLAPETLRRDYLAALELTAQTLTRLAGGDHGQG
ncbi:WYL domain-containing protein [Brevibacterium sp. 50QC2O2]|uniref:helix-turn-helix transcriptional regulator n=1 Tax=Brevibacterium sp. 50QC2O2 TaxID=2968459 RepID=UPI00211C3C19|nr:WYL domain-containing protein [Brevibacterium sp. 50QC2O2]MCQ9388841.1 WYL domain-containing protein [Brevibacterium sp. 50QC2O2]